MHSYNRRLYGVGGVQSRGRIGIEPDRAIQNIYRREGVRTELVPVETLPLTKIWSSLSCRCIISLLKMSRAHKIIRVLVVNCHLHSISTPEQQQQQPHPTFPHLSHISASMVYISPGMEIERNRGPGL